MDTPIVIELPWPPTVNTYWRSIVMRGRVRVLISKRGRQYRQAVAEALLSQRIPRRQISGALGVTLKCYPPDRRARDLDNLPKGVLDGLTRAGLWGDDSQVDRLTTERHMTVPGGRLVAVIERVNLADRETFGTAADLVERAIVSRGTTELVDSQQNRGRS